MNLYLLVLAYVISQTFSSTQHVSSDNKQVLVLGHRNPDTDAITAAIVLWNTVYLERVTNAIITNGKIIDNEHLQYLSPLGWEHINLTGDYLWKNRVKVGAGKFRPLRATKG